MNRNTAAFGDDAGPEVAKLKAKAGVGNFAEVLADGQSLYVSIDEMADVEGLSFGKFTDIPLVLYCERLSDNGVPFLQYTVIFSNEDGGTSTRGLMARWGRTTDIEFVYRVFLDASGNRKRAMIQGRGDRKSVV